MPDWKRCLPAVLIAGMAIGCGGDAGSTNRSVTASEDPQRYEKAKAEAAAAEEAAREQEAQAIGNALEGVEPR